MSGSRVYNNLNTFQLMEFKGRIAKGMPVQSGASQDGNEWSRQDFVFEYFEHETDRYSDKVMLSIMGKDRIAQYDIHEGDEVVIGFGHSVREYQGRTFNEVRMYKFDKVRKIGHAASNVQQPVLNFEQKQQPAQSPAQAPAPGSMGPENDDLPF